MLHTEPSFCIYADEDGCLQNEKRDLETKSSKKSDSSGEFSFAERSMGLIVEDEESNGFKNEEIQPPSPKMYLATGFGIDGIGGTEFTPTLFDDEYYKMIVDQDPYNPLALRKCAQFLQVRSHHSLSFFHFPKFSPDCKLLSMINDYSPGVILLELRITSCVLHLKTLMMVKL